MQQQVPKKKSFKRVTYRGVDVEDLMEMPIQEIAPLLKSSARRRIRRGFSKEEIQFLLDCVKAKQEVEGTTDKPMCVTTKSRSMVILPQLVGNVVGVHNGRDFVSFEIKPEMVGFRLGEFSSPQKSVTHGKPGIGATSSSKFVPLK